LPVKPKSLPATDVLLRLRDRLRATTERGGLRRLPGDLPPVDFCSNDYLGLARDLPPAAAGAGGATGSRLISGDRTEYATIEAGIADFHGAPTALVFPSGYAANTGLLSCLPQRGDTVLYDELIHASLRDGIRLSPARAYSFRHNDTGHLAQRLERATGARFIVVESIYSMDGDRAPLPAYAELAERYGAALIVDEAHATGIHGPRGSGLVPELGLAQRVLARTVTFGKALGSHGAAVLGPAELRDYLVNFSRPFIYTTGLAPQSWHHIAAAYEHLQAEQPARSAQLQARIDYFRRRAVAVPGERLLPVDGPIQGVVIPGNEAVVAVEAALARAGIAVKAIRHPTVPAGAERLRICLHSYNTEAEIDRLWSVLREQLREA
jgi:8-amino-7-oxononanoate synthase